MSAARIEIDDIAAPAAGGRAAPRSLRRAAFAAELALATVLAVMLARLVWTLAAPEAFAPRVETPVAAQTAPQARGAQDWSVLWRFDPFNRNAVAEAAVEDAPETTLNLKLNGVRAAGEAGGVAYITLPDNSQGAFRAGKDILDGVRLAAVYRDRVIIRRNGAPESLYLDGGRKPFSGQSAVSQGAARPAPAIAREPAPPRTVDVGGLLGEVALSPAYEGARFQGFRIQSSNAPLLAQYQLKNGDVIESVDGTRLTRDGDPAALAQMFETQGTIELTISRDGDRLTRGIQLGDTTQ